MPDIETIRASADAADITLPTALRALTEGQTPLRKSRARARFFAELERRGVKVALIVGVPEAANP
jgi:hypothetical protein